MSSQDELQDLLKQGIELARTGSRVEAREIFEQVIRYDQLNEQAWLWMAAVAETKPQRREALEIVLEINPDNDRARQALARLGGPRAARKAELGHELATRVGGGEVEEADFQPLVEVIPEPEIPIEPDFATGPEMKVPTLADVVREAGAAPLPEIPVAPEDVYDFRKRDRQRFLSRLRVTVELFVILLAVGVLVTAVVLRRDQISALLATATPTSTPRPSATATYTPSPVLVVVVTRATLETELPATWTPSPTGTPAPSATPSPTPPALESYSLVFARRPVEDVRYGLMRVRGDGSELMPLAAGYGGSDREPAPAPDGRSVVYSTDVDGTRTLVIAALEEGIVPGFEPVLDTLASLGGRRTGNPSWSGDGSRLAFSSDADGDEEIYVINADGTGLARLTDNDGVDRDPAWSPDGGTIVFASDRDGAGQTELYSMRPNGTGVTPLTDAAGSSYQPAWSPDGSLLVFVSDRRRDADLYIMRPDGADERLLTRDDDDAEDRSPAWSPDGRWIAFSSNRDGTHFRIYLTDPHGERLLRVTDDASDDYDVAWINEVPRR